MNLNDMKLSTRLVLGFGVLALLLAGLALARRLTRFSLVNAAFVLATCGLVVGALRPPVANSTVSVLPKIMAPAARSTATQAASWPGR